MTKIADPYGLLDPNGDGDSDCPTIQCKRLSDGWQRVTVRCKNQCESAVIKLHRPKLEWHFDSDGKYQKC